MDSFSFTGLRRVSEMGADDGCTAARMNSMPLSSHLSMVEVPRFMLS